MLETPIYQIFLVGVGVSYSAGDATRGRLSGRPRTKWPEPHPVDLSASWKLPEHAFLFMVSS